MDIWNDIWFSVFPFCSELESVDFTILVYNKGWEDVTVTASARPLFKLLDGNVVFFWFKWLWSTLITTKVSPGQTKPVNKVTKCNAVTYKLGSFGWKLYTICVRRKLDGAIATCLTPLNCTWIVEENGIYQANDPMNRCRFTLLVSS